MNGSDEKRKILDMLAQGKLTVSEASELLDAIKGESPKSVPEMKDTRGRKKNLRVDINAADGGRDVAKVRVNLPLSLIKIITPLMKSGVVPDETLKELNAKGIDLNKITEMMESVTDELASSDEDLVNIEAIDGGDGATVKVYVD